MSSRAFRVSSSLGHKKGSIRVRFSVPKSAIQGPEHESRILNLVRELVVAVRGTLPQSMTMAAPPGKPGRRRVLTVDEFVAMLGTQRLTYSAMLALFSAKGFSRSTTKRSRAESVAAGRVACEGGVYFVPQFLENAA